MAGAPVGNNNAGKNKPITEMIMLALHEEVELHGKKTNKMRVLAQKLVDRAVGMDDEGNPALPGDLAAQKEITDRIEGKSTQPIDAAVSGDMSITVVTNTPDRDGDGG